MDTLGAPELIIILIVIVLLFGSSKLPKLARSLGQASKEFKRGVAGGDQAESESPAEAPAPVEASQRADRVQDRSTRSTSGDNDTQRHDTHGTTSELDGHLAPSGVDAANDTIAEA